MKNENIFIKINEIPSAIGNRNGFRIKGKRNAGSDHQTQGRHLIPLTGNKRTFQLKDWLTSSGKPFVGPGGAFAQPASHKTGCAHFFDDIAAVAFRTGRFCLVACKDQSFKFFPALVALIFVNRHGYFSHCP